MNKLARNIPSPGQTLEIRRLGDFLAVILPDDFAERHGFKAGDRLD